MSKVSLLPTSSSSPAPSPTKRVLLPASHSCQYPGFVLVSAGSLLCLLTYQLAPGNPKTRRLPQLRWTEPQLSGPLQHLLGFQDLHIVIRILLRHRCTVSRAALTCVSPQMLWTCGVGVRACRWEAEWSVLRRLLAKMLKPGMLGLEAGLCSILRCFMLTQ